jgi:predicted component of type VI protein secretion system
MVRLSSLSKDTSKLLSPGDKGVVDFFALPSGSIKVSAEYKTQGTSKVSPLQTFELPLKRTVPEPSYTININDVVDLAEVPSPMNQEKGTTPTESDNKGDPAAKDTGSATRRDSTPNILGSILVFIFVAAAVLVGIWALLRVLQRNPKVIEDNLAKIGVQVPSVDPADDGAIPIATPMPQGPHKIVLDGADPTPATSSVSGASAAAHNPRLQTSTGTLIQLPEGTNLVTREPGSILSFPGESSISRRHAEITVQSGQARVVDLGSTNGTFVNGKKLTGEQILMPGDSVQFGSLVLRYET